MSEHVFYAMDTIGGIGIERVHEEVMLRFMDDQGVNEDGEYIDREIVLSLTDYDSDADVSDVALLRLAADLIEGAGGITPFIDRCLAAADE